MNAGEGLPWERNALDGSLFVRLRVSFCRSHAKRLTGGIHDPIWHWLPNGNTVWIALDEATATRHTPTQKTIRDLIQQQRVGPAGSLGAALADLCGCLSGSKDLSTRPLKGYGRR